MYQGRMYVGEFLNDRDRPSILVPRNLEPATLNSHNKKQSVTPSSTTIATIDNHHQHH